MQVDDALGKRIGVVCDEKVRAVLTVNALHPQGGGDHGTSSRHGFNRFDAHATSGAQRDDHDARIAEHIPRVRYFAQHRCVRPLYIELVVEFSSRKFQLCFRKLAQHGGPHLVQEPLNSLHIWIPIHGTDVKDVINGPRYGRWQLGIVEPKWQGEHRTGAPQSLEVFAVLCRDGRDGIKIMKRIHLVGLQAFRQMLQIHALCERFRFSGHQFPNAVFHIVRPQHERAVTILPHEGQVWCGEQALENDQIEHLPPEHVHE